MSYARIDAGATGVFAGTVKDPDGVAIPLANITSATLTLTDAASGSTVNSRSNQNVLNLNNVTIDATTGALVWAIQVGDTTLLSALADFEEHVATFTIAFNPNSQKLIIVHRLHCASFRSLCTFDDVKLQAPAISDADQALIETMIGAVTKRAEFESGRVFRKSTVANPTTEYFSPLEGQTTVRVRRWPIDSITSIKESLDGDFSTATALASTDYAIVRSGETNEGEIRLRWRSFFEGVESVQVIYAGGLARDVGQVPSDLRYAAIRQVVYWYQRRDSLGVTSESVQGANVSFNFPLDLLPDVERVVRSYRPQTAL